MDRKERNKEVCRECGRYFSDKFNLRRHVRQFHSEKVDELCPLKNSSNFKFTCGQCQKNFNHKKHFNFHVKVHYDKDSEAVEAPTQLERQDKTEKKCKKCPMCEYTTSFTKEIHIHFSQVHDILITTKEIDVPSLDKFHEWKALTENHTNSRFVKQTGDSNAKIINKYVCHRSGNYIPKGKNQRHLKLKGSCKIQAFCPASMKILKDKASYKIVFVETHVGHQNNIGQLTLTTSEKKMIAQKIASKIPFQAIRDEVLDSLPTSESELKRIHLLSSKDLHNIEHCFNLSSEAVRHSNDAVSVEAWVTDMQKNGDCVLFYKAQGVFCEDKPYLKQEDFVLMLMTQAQCDFLVTYGNDCVCLDGTHGLNNYDFEMNTLLVLDDLREGFPCAFLISNRSDTEVMKLFFSEIKNRAGVIKPQNFMSDLAETFYNAWIEEMGIPERRLFCSWHIIRAWTKNLCKIKNKEKQAEVSRKVRTLLEERDALAFEKMIETFCSVSDPDTRDFIEYFKTYYFDNRMCWSYCYRLHAGLNTNMHLERMHGTIKYLFLQGKKVKRLDKAIAAIMRFVRSKLINRLIVEHRGKISNKIKNLRDRHKKMQSLNVNLITKTSYGWEVVSETTTEIYFIEEIPSKTMCDCKLVCTYCEVCIHRYSCSCVDSSIQYNMCKHVHLLVKWEKSQQINESTQTKNLEDDESSLYIHCPPNNAETNTILRELGQEKDSQSLKIQKETLSKNFDRQLQKIDSAKKMEVVKKVINRLSPTLNAMASSSTITLPKTNNTIVHNAKITAQRFWSTKKRIKKRDLRKPTADEINQTAMLLLNP